MKRYLFILFALLLSATMFSCISYRPPKQYQFDKSRIINKTYEDTWTRVISWMAANNIPIRLIDKNSGIIESKDKIDMSFLLNCMDCGTAGITENQTNYSGNFNIQVIKKSDNQTEVYFNAFFRAVLERVVSSDPNSPPLTYFNPILCASTGVLERQFFEFISR